MDNPSNTPNYFWKYGIVWFIIPWVFLSIGLALWASGNFRFQSKPDPQILLVDKIESLGKLELVKYHFKEIVEHKLSRDWLPDPSALLIIGGEAVGSLDLRLIKKEDIQVIGDSISVHLPKPSIAYVKINHSESKVYSTQFAFWDEAKLIDESYKEAEKQILKTAEKSDILEQTKINSIPLLKTFLTNLGFKKVSFHF